MTQPVAPIIHGDSAEKCTVCGHAFRGREPIFVAVPAWPRDHLGHAVCGACKPVKTVWGSAADWQGFACENCGREVRYLYGREYRTCTYHCAAALRTRNATNGGPVNAPGIA